MRYDVLNNERASRLIFGELYFYFVVRLKMYDIILFFFFFFTQILITHTPACEISTNICAKKNYKNHDMGKNVRYISVEFHYWKSIGGGIHLIRARIVCN